MIWRRRLALAAIAFAKAKRRRQIMVATSSIGPGATNMVTAAGVAHANRLPVLLLSGDTFANRLPDPVLQQVEHFGNPTVTVNDAFKAVTRYWDRIVRPEQLIASLPQDIQAEAFDYPAEFFERRVHQVPRPRADVEQLVAAAGLLRQAKQPLIVAGGGVHYSLATAELARSR